MEKATGEFVPREECARCRRPRSACYCAHVRPVATRTRVVILQHPRERDMPIGTARMATLCLPNSKLLIGADWEQSAALRSALGDAGRPPVLLFPGAGARDIAREPLPGPVTLVVLDGTWRQARSLLKRNPTLAALPRVAFTPEAPSEYRIRKEPREDYVSTIEALMHVLGVLEGDAARFEALRAPFRAMVDRQIECEVAHRHLGSRHGKFRERARAKRPRLPAELRRWEDLLCLVVEANAWPRRRVPDPVSYEDEPIQIVARRPATGETLALSLAPTFPLAPRIPAYVGLGAERILAGLPRKEAFARWSAFLRPTDVLCVWGTYGLNVLAGAGGARPAVALDLRRVVRDEERGSFGALDGYVAKHGIAVGEPLSEGRAGRRLAELMAVTEHLHRRAAAAE